ncbi:PulJ/GspJ family protein [Lyngbya confervoides]|uniref:Prepilin-type N-terminal cleavage/methylation domain-containing protein n=1 Tax=Lyngbya confervoides BDU141951 TaxID=1574623 RepID=A0ABD4SYR7_9CYAN|nr:hypothetical protein [Lyngbya confervoides]MCM1981498.1 hypothetical protein [Lyngbya confervoides BDU141951]
MTHRHLAHLQGFSLPEVLLSLGGSSIILILCGLGLSTVSQINQHERTHLHPQQELTRALDFLSAEIHQAQALESVPPAASQYHHHVENAADPLLILKMPQLPRDERVVYFVAPASTPWKGPKAIYRWGPAWDEAGQYQSAPPSHWSIQLIADQIAEAAVPAECPTGTVLPTTPTGISVCMNPAGSIAKITAHRSPEADPVSTKAFTRLKLPPF